MRVLVIEKDSATAQSIELMLKAEAFTVYTTDLGEEGVDLGRLYDYDAIVTELSLPDMSGFDVIRSLRKSEVPAPILVLSGLGGVPDKVRAIGYGADDYMTKPFHKDELVARLHALVRRSRGIQSSIASFGNMTIEFGKQQVRIGGEHIHLTAKLYVMLELMALRPNTTITREMFLNHMYGGLEEPLPKIMDVFICKLRRILTLAGLAGAKIETVWGRGFMLATKDTAAAKAGELQQHIADALAA